MNCRLRCISRPSPRASGPYKAGRLINQLRELAETVDKLPRVERPIDPTDDFLLALSESGKADYLVTGDKSGLLALVGHRSTRIVSARDFAASLEGSQTATGGGEGRKSKNHGHVLQ